MKLIKTLPSTAARSFRAKPAHDVNLYGGNIVRALQRRYGFLEIPTRVAQFDLQKGVKFLQGLFEKSTVDLEVLEHGLRAFSPSGTEVCDRFLDDIVALALNAGVEMDDPKPQRIYSSVVEVEFTGDFAAQFKKFANVGTKIGSMIGTYGGPEEPYQPLGISMIGRLSGVSPDMFKLERRVDTDFNSNVFFSMAPLALADHLVVLEDLEMAIS